MKNKKELDKKRIFIRLTIFLMIAIILLFLGAIAYKYIDVEFFSKDNIQSIVSNSGSLAPIIFILISFLQVTIIPIPSTITIFIGSYIFGGILGFIYSYIGIVLGSLFAFFLGRKIGRKFVNWIAGDEEIVAYYLAKLKGKENIVLFFMFLFPFFPDDLICSIAGLLPVKWRTFILMQLVTRATTISGNIIVLSGEIIPFSGWGIPVLIILCIASILLFILSMKYSDKINKYFDDLIDKITFKKKKD